MLRHPFGVREQSGEMIIPDSSVEHFITARCSLNPGAAASVSMHRSCKPRGSGLDRDARVANAAKHA